MTNCTIKSLALSSKNMSMVLYFIIIKADTSNDKKKRRNNKDMLHYLQFSVQGKKGRNNSWQPKGLKRIEFYKYFGEKGAQVVRKGH